jgi:hypothetical protein
MTDPNDIATPGGLPPRADYTVAPFTDAPPASAPEAAPTASDDLVLAVRAVQDMSLRDWFAGQALAETAQRDHGNPMGKYGADHVRLAARAAYAYADAMLAESGK